MKPVDLALLNWIGIRRSKAPLNLMMFWPFSIFLITLFLLFSPVMVESFSNYDPWVNFFNPYKMNEIKYLTPVKMKSSNRIVSPNPSGEAVTIAQVLSDPDVYHKKIIKVRGTVTQPELHVDESGLFIRFVFVLKDGEHSLIVFGHHDRTKGNIQVETNEKVEVIGIFWKERTANEHHFRNNLEAITVTKYPQLYPDAA